jgi:hypothetical protein
LTIWFPFIKNKEISGNDLWLKHMIWCWKDLIEGYIFLALTYSIEVHMKELWTHKIPIIWESLEFWPFQCNLHHNYSNICYMKEGICLLPSLGHVNIVSPKTSLWPKINFILNLLGTPFSPMWRARKHTPKFSFFFTSFHYCPS